MSTDEFLADVLPALRAAELAALNGDPGPRLALWTTVEPADWLGQFGTHVRGVQEVADHFRRAVSRFTDGTQLQFDILSVDVVGDVAHLVTVERVRFGIDGAEPVTMTFRISRVFRREGGAWRCAHGHADLDPATLDLPWKPPRAGTP
jgi:ketosteroid isomerase-like protein